MRLELANPVLFHVFLLGSFLVLALPASRTASRPLDRFFTDELRGIAILGIVLHHLSVHVLKDPWQLPLFHVLAGGALLGAIFMATDYSTSPMTVRGGVIFGIGIGAITMCIRLWGAYPEGMSFAILIMNACVPLINKYVKPKRFGVK